MTVFKEDFISRKIALRLTSALSDKEEMVLSSTAHLINEFGHIKNPEKYSRQDNVSGVLALLPV